jgi:hypothetical protein
MASQLLARPWIDGHWIDAHARVESINPAVAKRNRALRNDRCVRSRH